MFLIVDFMFYWVHRSLHWSGVYKYIHKQHHMFKQSVGIAAEYAHPVEGTWWAHGFDQNILRAAY